MQIPQFIPHGAISLEVIDFAFMTKIREFIIKNYLLAYQKHYVNLK